jgi:Lipocalin-like domain
VSTPAQSARRPQHLNKIAGTWAPASVQAEIDGKTVDLFGPTPGGSLIFTESMRFSVALNNPRLPRFASDNSAKATDAETPVAASGALALYGAYAVDEGGQFLDQVVEGLDPSELERAPDGPQVRIVWRRVD